MHSLYKFLFLFLAACVLSSCEQKRDEPVIEISSKPTESFEGFARDTSAYALVIDTTVRDSVFNGKIVHVKRGGFVEYFANEAENLGTNGQKIFYAYSDSVNPFVKGYSEEPSFINLVALAYAKHYAMEINPDDIWLMILDGFRLHVKNNRDALKDRFVAPGTDTVVSVMDKSLTLESTHKEWFYTLSELFDSLQAKLPLETGAPLRTKFSTTSPVDANISRTMTMAVASEYYSYRVSTLCGIPKIKVNGTKEDWALLKDSFNRLASQLDMKWWADGLNPILDEFINIYDGKINLKHWKNIYKYYEPEGCGAPDFSGWISRFFPYTKDLYSDTEKYIKRNDWNKKLDGEQVPRGITFIDIRWEYFQEIIPLKLYTGFIGVQVDTTNNMLKASRGYALVSYGLQKLKNVARNTKYIPGKAYRLVESLAFSDSMNVYGEKGLVYATNNADEIEEFAEFSSFDEEYPEAELWRREMVGVGEPNLSINLYRDGKLVDHLLYYAKPRKETFKERVLVFLTSDYDGVMLSLQGVGRWKKPATIKNFFKERDIPISGTVHEFENEKSLPKLNVEIFVDSVFLKEGKSLRDGLEMRAFKTGIVRAMNNSMGWRLKRLLYRYYKEDFNLSGLAALSYKDDGSTASTAFRKGKNKAFDKEFHDILYYGWMPPKVHTDIGNEETAQDIIDYVLIHLTFTRDYRMVCKQNGRDAKDSVDIVGAPDAKKDLCNEITFSKDLATGGVVRYECIEYNKKVKYGERSEEIESRHTNVRINKYDAVYDGRLSISQVVTLKIPSCFVEEKLNKQEDEKYNEDFRF
ncbi:DUF4419 domain-containing protein [Fibrobacter sp. UWB12]|uniref:DUF4419 domain-containing protein n=1 Tax=Fibrobacter sp. UWB12 TaxID=1896203 RepID=UPI00091AAA83|nr:DUF4419 domain-containing protein [Fibrobacter sp. UWB12]SHK93124.1 protein of unknown function [Fibrobacter sp. UWB12]